MSTITPSARTWTLRFKHHRTTVLVHVDPLQRWALVRADLLRALHQTNPSGTLPDTNLEIPRDPDDVLLARLVDPNDTMLGWVSLDAEPAFSDDNPSAVTGNKGKGKAAVKPKIGKEASMKDCPQGAGLRDGSVLAFKFRGHGDGVEGKVEEEEGDGDWEKLDADGETLVGELEAEKWDVVMPSYEDTYEDDEIIDEGLGMDG